MTSRTRRKLVTNTIALAAGALLCAGTWAQGAAAQWPAKPVSIVVGYSAGGPTDAVARILAEHLTTTFGQSFVIENKAGAGGGLAATQVARATPDGYTLMFGSSGTLSILPHMQKNLAFDPIDGFTHIGLVASYPYFLVVPGSSRLQSLDDLLKAGADANKPLNYGSAGVGAVNHLAGEWFKYEAKIHATHIPFRGDSAMVNDLIGDRVDFAFIAGAAAFPQLNSGNLRILASASATPGRGGQNLVTLGETLYPGFAAEPWNGLMGPLGIPDDIVTKLNTAINDIMHREDVAKRLSEMEQYPFTGTPQDYKNHIIAETKRWGTVIANAKIEVE